MIDLILFAFFAATFVVGFWLGKTFLTWAAAVARAKAWVKSLLN